MFAKATFSSMVQSICASFTCSHRTIISDLSAVHHQITNSTALLLDVRSSEEYSRKHVKQAVLAPHASIDAQIAMMAPDKSLPIYLYCRSGARSEVALRKLTAMGYDKVVNLGGINDITSLGFDWIES